VPRCLPSVLLSLATDYAARALPCPTPCRPTTPSPLPSQSAEADLCRISNKVRFILAVVAGELKLSNRRKADIEAELEDEGYDKLPSQKKAKAQVGELGAEWQSGGN